MCVFKSVCVRVCLCCLPVNLALLRLIICCTLLCSRADKLEVSEEALQLARSQEARTQRAAM